MEKNGLGIYGSEPFELVVSGRSIYMHKALITNVSGPLDRLVSNGMSETQEGRAYLDDESEATVTRFAHWAYAGFYFAGEISKRPDTEAQNEVIKEIDGAALISSNPISLTRRIKKPSTFGDIGNRPMKKEALKEAFLRLQFSKPDDERVTSAIRANTDTSEDYTNVFLSHARLYTFAETWDIQPLKRLALRNLHRTLAAFTLWPECVKDVVTLLRFTYGHTAQPQDGQEPMRSMLNKYITYEIDKMLGEDIFQDFLAESRDFLDDFCSDMKSRI